MAHQAQTTRPRTRPRLCRSRGRGRPARCARGATPGGGVIVPCLSAGRADDAGRDGQRRPRAEQPARQCQHGLGPLFETGSAGWTGARFGACWRGRAGRERTYLLPEIYSTSSGRAGMMPGIHGPTLARNGPAGICTCPHPFHNPAGTASERVAWLAGRSPPTPARASERAAWCVWTPRNRRPRNEKTASSL